MSGNRRRVSLTLAVALVVVATATPFSAEPVRRDGPQIGGTMHSSRDALRLCIVDLTANGLDVSNARASFQSAAMAVVTSDSWRQRGLPTRPAEVRVGCTQTPSLQRAARVQDRRRPGFDQTLAKHVVVPSPEQAMIVVMDDARIQELFGDAPLYFRAIVEERLCEDRPPGSAGPCDPVTIGVYVTRDEVTDQASVSRVMARAVFELPRPSEWSTSASATAATSPIRIRTAQPQPSPPPRTPNNPDRKP